MWLIRLMVNEEGTNVITYNEETESIVYMEEYPMYTLEYAHN